MANGEYSFPSSYGLIPPAIKNLLLANIAVFVVQLGFNHYAIPLFALWPLNTPGELFMQTGRFAVEPGFYIWQLITSGFMHSTAGFGHILLNMFALWMFGSNIERLWGTKRFLIYYFVCLLVASITQLIVTTAGGMYTPTVGASGAVFGILLAFGMMFPNVEIMLIFFPVPIKAKYFVMMYGALELFSGVVGTASNIAHFAHLGGMVGGFFLILYWRGKLPFSKRKPWMR